MRFGSLVFLALFGLFVLRHRIDLPFARHSLRLSCAAPCSDSGRASPPSARVRELQSELDRLERRGRDLERSHHAVAQSARTLRDLVKRHDDPALRAELAEIEEGRDRIAALRERTEIERVTVSARLQLARSGVFDDEERPERKSPVDALSAVEGAARSVRASRAR